MVDLVLKLLKIAAWLLLCGWLGRFVLRTIRITPFLEKNMNEERFDALVMIVGGVASCLSLVGLVYMTAWFADVL